MTRKRRFHRKSRLPKDPETKPFKQWLPENKGCYAKFQDWLRETGCSLSTIAIYSGGVRWALGWLDQPYWTITDTDLARAAAHIQPLCQSPATWKGYRQGLVKFTAFLHLTCQTSVPEKEVNWAYYLEGLPAWLASDIRGWLAHCQRQWLPETYLLAARNRLSHLTRFLRWTTATTALAGLSDLTPKRWHAYLDERLAAGIKPVSLNSELTHLQAFVGFWKDEGRVVNERLLRLQPLKKGRTLPKDLPATQLQQLLQEVDRLIQSSHAGLRRWGLRDKAWVLLMLHGGLRTSEVRRLKLSDLDWEKRRLRLEQAKGLKDRVIFLSDGVIEALKAYLEVRGPADALPAQVFIFHHHPLSPSYCYERLRTYGAQLGLKITPHLLRHSCATLLLNAGAPVASVQAILGHRYLSTTLRYARLYDQTVAADYYRAMAHVERQLALPEDEYAPEQSVGELIALADALKSSVLNDHQLESLHALRSGLLVLAQREAQETINDV
jgi:integrase/recombinase XerD